MERRQPTRRCICFRASCYSSKHSHPRHDSRVHSYAHRQAREELTLKFTRRLVASPHTSTSQPTMTDGPNAGLESNSLPRPVSEADADQDTCRICSAPGEPDQPLFHPCKCSGTIRYIHQDWYVHCPFTLL